ncbi:MAG: ATP-binding protein [Pseudomonadota bacterium]|nr:ATP-binding protein [Pseudomonadota bacterium]
MVEKHRLSPLQCLALLSVLVVLLLLGGVVYHLADGYATAIRETRRTTQNLALVLEKHAASTVDVMDLVLTSIASLRPSDGQLLSLHTADAQAFLKGFLTTYPQISDIVILDNRGTMVHSALFSTYWGEFQSMDFSDREYFRAHRNDPEAGLYIGPPMISRTLDTWFIPMSRRLNAPDGGFAGVALAVIDPLYLQAFYQSLEVGRNGVVALLNGDGLLMVRHPFDPELLGKTSNLSRAVLAQLSQAPAGTFTAPSLAAAGSHIASYRAVAGAPLVIAVAIARRHALADWRDQLRTTVGVAGLAVLTILLLSLLLARQLQRQQTLTRDLEQSRGELRSILRAIPDPLMILDSEGRYKEIYDGAPERLAAVKGKSIHEVLPAEVSAQVQRAIDQVLATDQVQTLDYHLPVDGAERWFSARAAALDGRQPPAVLWIERDITGHKRAEQALRDSEATLRRQAAQLQEDDRRKNEFLAVLAHELRNPLTPIQMAAEMLNAYEGPLDTGLRWARNVLGHQVEQMARLLDDLLDVARITRGKIVLQKTPVDLAGVVARAMETANPLIDARRHEITVSLPAQSLWVEADPLRLGQVIANLLHNAARYTPEGGRIRLTVRREPAQAVIEVKDNGIGMAADLLPRIFDVFAQADSARGGLGLGLTLARSLAEMHGGSLEAASPGPGQGSTFTVRLPLLGEGWRTEPPPAPAPRYRGPPRRVLVVDDYPAITEGLTILLQMLGHEVHSVGSGEAALDAARRWRPEMVFLDIGLPDLDGREVARRLRAEHGAAPILVALTGYDQEQATGCAEPFDGCLLKPVNLHRLHGLFESLWPGG